VKICLPKSKRCPKSKVKVNVLNWSEKVKFWDLFKDGLSLWKLGSNVGKMNQASCVLSSAPLLFLNGGRLENMDLHVPRISSTQLDKFIAISTISYPLLIFHCLSLSRKDLITAQVPPCQSKESNTFFWDRISLCSPGWPKICNLECCDYKCVLPYLVKIILFKSLVLGLNA
jgi:hypothetical protein